MSQTPPQIPTHKDGNQIVRVGQENYLWSGQQQLRVGDVVLLPGSTYDPAPRTATITALGSQYRGTMKHVLHLVAGVEDAPLARVVRDLLTSATANADTHLLQIMAEAASWHIGSVTRLYEDGDLLHMCFTLIVTDEYGNQTDTIDTDITVVRSDFYHTLTKL